MQILVATHTNKTENVNPNTFTTVNNKIGLSHICEKTNNESLRQQKLNQNSHLVNIQCLIKNMNSKVPLYHQYHKAKLISPLIKRKLYCLYSIHFFNFLKKTNTKIIKGIILKNKKNKFFILIKNINIPLSKIELTYDYCRRFLYQKKKVASPSKPAIVFCETIQINPNQIKLRISRNKILQLF